MATKDRFYEIDLLRFIAALAVVLYHFAYRGWAWDGFSDQSYPEFGFLFKYGFLGVDLFFIISGFVVLLTALGRTGSQFVISRMVRLYPAYWFGVLFTSAVIVICSDGRFQVSVPQIFANLTMLQTFIGSEHVDNVYWSLIVELKFYLLVFLLIVFGQISNLLFFLYAWVLVTLYMLGFGNIDKVAFFLFPEWAGYFIAGAAFFLIYQQQRVKAKHGTLLLLSYCACLLSAYNRASSTDANYGMAETMVVTVIFVTLAFILFLAIAMRHTKSKSRPWFQTAGLLTYPLYLVHQNAGYIFLNATSDHLNRFVALVIAIVSSILLSWVVSKYVELPLAPRLKSVLQTVYSSITPVDQSTRH